MPPTPVLAAIRILRTAVFQALGPLTLTGVYWQRADQGVALPFVVYQSQDLGGAAVERIGSLDWQGLVTVKALAGSQSAAETLLAAVAPGMASLSAAGSSITTRYVRPIVIPPDGDIWQAAHQWRVWITGA